MGNTVCPSPAGCTPNLACNCSRCSLTSASFWPLKHGVVKNDELGQIQFRKKKKTKIPIVPIHTPNAQMLTAEPDGRHLDNDRINLKRLQIGQILILILLPDRRKIDKIEPCAHVFNSDALIIREQCPTANGLTILYLERKVVASIKLIILNFKKKRTSIWNSNLARCSKRYKSSTSSPSSTE